MTVRGLRGAGLAAVCAATALVGPADLAAPRAAMGAEGDAAAAEVRDVSELLAPIVARHEVPGLVAVRVDAGRVTAQGAAGVRRRGGEERVTVDDRMHLGSCTKAMTATLCALLVAEGKLSWDARPADMFAEDAGPFDDGWNAATLEQLLRNRGGAPHTLDAGGVWAGLWRHPGPPSVARLALVRGVLRRPPSHEPGTTFEYSNAGFAIAGAMAERAAGVEYERLLRKRLFEPLGMASAGFGAPGTRDRVDQPRGHRKDGTVVEPGPASDNPDAIAPAGKVHASLPDWAKFASLHAGRGKGVDGPLARIDFARLHTPPEGAEYAMGWIATRRGWAKGAGRDDVGFALHHAGDNTMWYAVAWLAPEREMAVLVASNQTGAVSAKACDEAAGLLVR